MDNDPFHKLPQEMITMVALDIREVEVHHSGLGITRWKPPLKAMLVCRSWYDTIRAEARFWRQLRVTSRVTAATLSAALTRSGVMPLEIWVDSLGLGNEDALAVLHPHRQRWEVLVLGDDEDHHPSAVSNEHVKSWVVGELPNLKRLHVGGVALGANDDGRPTNITLPNLESLSFWSTIPCFHFPNSPLLHTIRLEDCMISLTKLLRYLSDASESLRSFAAYNTLVTDLGGRDLEWKLIEMPSLEEVKIQADGYDGLAQDVLKNIRCPSLRTLTYRAPNDHVTAWAPLDLDLPLLQSLDFRDHLLPPEALRDILFASPSLQRLVLPKLNDDERAQDALEVLVQYAAYGGGVLADVTDNGFDPTQLRRLVEALPSIQRVDVTDGGFTSWEFYEEDEEKKAMKWLQENLLEIVGLEEVG